MHVFDINYIIIVLLILYAYVFSKKKTFHFLFLFIFFISIALEFFLKCKIGSCCILFLICSCFPPQDNYKLLLVLMGLFLYINNIFSIYVLVITGIKLFFLMKYV
jgi:hypothetical protein